MLEADDITCFFVFLQMLTILVTGRPTMDEMISNAAETPEMFAMPQPSGQGSASVIRTELDMVFTPRQWDYIQSKHERAAGDPNRRYLRKAINQHVYRWPGGVIPYEFDNNARFSSKDMSEIQQGIEEWQKFTCVRFVKAQHSHANRVRFTNGGGCFSNVGMVKGTQTVGLAHGCRWKSVVAHELGHAVGFQHEQTRPDRDRYVTILTQNIPPHLQYNFRKYSPEDVDTFRLPYDYRSIMHYGTKAFSYNGRPTIRTREARYQDVIGTAKGLSFLDIKLANLMYRCNARCPAQSGCPTEGFMDSDCRCMCPGDPVLPCSERITGSGSETTTGSRTGSETSSSIGGTATPGNECRDQYARCQEWASKECEDPVNRVYMQAYCRRSCRLCDHEPGEEDECRDRDKDCEFWRGEGHCTHAFVDFMRTNCPQSCGYCSPTITYSPQRNKDEKKHHYAVSSSNALDDVKASAVTTQAMTFHVVVGVAYVWILQ